MGSPTRTAFSVLNTQRQLAKSLEADRIGASPSDFTQREARGSFAVVGPVERSLRDKLLSEIPSLSSKEKAKGTKPSHESTVNLIARLRKKAQHALDKGDLEEASVSPYNHNVLTEELLRIAAVRNENEKQKDDLQNDTEVIRKTEEKTVLEDRLDLSLVESSHLDPLLVRTIRIDKTKIMVSKSGGGLIKRASIAPIDLRSYNNTTPLCRENPTQIETLEYVPLLEQLRSTPKPITKNTTQNGQNSVFKKLLD